MMTMMMMKLLVKNQWSIGNDDIESSEILKWHWANSNDDDEEVVVVMKKILAW